MSTQAKELKNVSGVVTFCYGSASANSFDFLWIRVHFLLCSLAASKMPKKLVTVHTIHHSFKITSRIHNTSDKKIFFLHFWIRIRIKQTQKVMDLKDPEHGTRNTEHLLTCVGWREGRQRWSGTRNTEHPLTCEGWPEVRQRWSGTRNTELPLTCVGWRAGRQRWSVPCSRRDTRSCSPSGRTDHPHRTCTFLKRKNIYRGKSSVNPADSPYFIPNRFINGF